VTSDAVLAARDLVVRPGARADGFTLRVSALALRRGEVLAILGPNGAGKTTLLRALAGLVAPSAGAIEVRAPRGVALVFQHPLLLAGSVAWNAEVPLWGRGIARRERRERACTALARFGIGALAERDATTLSGGEARRLALARAFVVVPDVLLLDEPFDDLDAAGREVLVQDLASAIHETDIAVAIVTHDLRQALLLADRIAVLSAGALAQLDARDEVLRHPASAEVAALVGMSNWLPGRVRSRDAGGLAVVELAPAATLRSGTACAVGTDVWVGIRPEHVKIDVDHSDPNTLGAASVETRVSDGALVVAWIAWSALRLRTHLLAGRGLGQTLKAGDGVFIAVRPEDVHVLPRGPA
jgi:ABC-type Fe3+/spermidine/putrescine transport system ATPase subunit